MGSAVDTQMAAAETVVPGDALPEDPMLTETDKAFVRSTGVGVFVGMVGMFLFVAAACRLVASEMGTAYCLALATFSALVTGGFFGGVVFASRFLIQQEKREADERAAARAAEGYVRAA
jgi:hypothetical protein